MKRSYLPIIEKWVKNFINSMNSDVKDGFAQPGEDFGNIPKGIKIIFDGYGYNERTDNQDDTNRMSFAVFIHKNSLVDYFLLMKLVLIWFYIDQKKSVVFTFGTM